MEYQELVEKGKKIMKNLTIVQKIVIALAIVIILAVAVYFINPPKKFLEMRNSQRRSDVVNILNSVYQYSIDHNGQLPSIISSTPTMICKTKAPSCDGLVDISEITSNKKYLLSQVPVDSKEKDVNSSGYQIVKLGSGRISVSAPLAENGAVISLSK